MIAIKIGTTSWRHTSALAGDEVEFTGEYLYEADGLTSAMVWDDTLQNVRSMTQADRDARAAAMLLQAYAAAKALLTADDPISKKEKAFVLVVMDEFNLHANKHNEILARVNAIAAAIVNGGTYAAMRTAVGNPAALTNYPQRTAAQLKTSIENKIDAGQADG